MRLAQQLEILLQLLRAGRVFRYIPRNILKGQSEAPY